ncbi:MAG: tRNA lysidine(34) synthetase TilS [Turicibacter sp.]|nr:tRNA lysidine(34) synthetase TilS [Turicibacter sp.]
MDTVLEKIRRTATKYEMFKAKDIVLVGVSGGADSVFMLHSLLNLRDFFGITLHVCHVNHNLRGKDAENDADFVKNLCKLLNLPFHYLSVQVTRGESVENAARNARYNALFQVAERIEASKIALGHTMDDNAETLILRLARGTGLAGLCGIPPVRPHETISIVRPLIEVERLQIEQFLAAHNLDFRTDLSNFNKNFYRNRVRLDIMPKLQTLNPKIARQLHKNISLFNEDEEFLDSLAKTALTRILSGNRLHIPTLLAEPPTIQKRTLRLTFAALTGLRDISQRHISAIIDLLSARTGKKLHLPHGISVRKEYEFLVINPEKMTKTPPPEKFSVELPIHSRIFVPKFGRYAQNRVLNYLPPEKSISTDLYTKRFNYDKIRGGLRIRFRTAGDRFTLANVGSKRLKDEFIDRKIPAELRDEIPLFAVGNDILWILGDLGGVAGYNRTNSAFLPVPNCQVLEIELSHE